MPTRDLLRRAARALLALSCWSPQAAIAEFLNPSPARKEPRAMSNGFEPITEPEAIETLAAMHDQEAASLPGARLIGDKRTAARCEIAGRTAATLRHLRSAATPVAAPTLAEYLSRLANADEEDRRAGLVDLCDAVSDYERTQRERIADLAREIAFLLAIPPADVLDPNDAHEHVARPQLVLVPSEDVTPEDVNSYRTHGAEPVLVFPPEASFGAAFARARALLGAEGMFRWHGCEFHTRTAEEIAGQPDFVALAGERIVARLLSEETTPEEAAEIVAEIDAEGFEPREEVGAPTAAPEVTFEGRFVEVLDEEGRSVGEFPVGDHETFAEVAARVAGKTVADDRHEGREAPGIDGHGGKIARLDPHEGVLDLAPLTAESLASALDEPLPRIAIEGVGVTIEPVETIAARVGDTTFEAAIYPEARDHQPASEFEREAVILAGGLPAAVARPAGGGFVATTAEEKAAAAREAPAAPAEAASLVTAYGVEVERVPASEVEAPSGYFGGIDPTAPFVAPKAPEPVGPAPEAFPLDEALRRLAMAEKGES